MIKNIGNLRFIPIVISGALWTTGFLSGDSSKLEKHSYTITAKEFKQEGLPKILRVSDFQKKDVFLVDTDNTGDYNITFEEYLKTLPEGYIRQTKENKINELVRL